MVDCPVPRALSRDEIRAVVDDFRRAAANAMRAGFDGVEIHAANGYLIDQFLRTTSNHREDEYGGPREHRLRFLLEVVDAVAAEVDPARIGVRMAPFITARNMDCPDIIPTILQAAREPSRRGVGYLHLAEADWDDAPQVPEDFRRARAETYDGRIIVAGGYDAARARSLLASGLVDLIAFGRAFIANPDPASAAAARPAPRGLRRRVALRRHRGRVQRLSGGHRDRRGRHGRRRLTGQPPVPGRAIRGGVGAFRPTGARRLPRPFRSEPERTM